MRRQGETDSVAHGMNGNGAAFALERFSIICTISIICPI